MRRRSYKLAALFTVLAAGLATVSIAWARQGGVFDQLDLLVDVRHELVHSYVKKPDQTKMVRAAVRGMIKSLDDPYTTYLDPEELTPFNKEVRGSFSGIGAQVDLHAGRPRIVTPLEDSPAWKAGVAAGDLILAINGKSTLDMSLSDTTKLLSGRPGTTVTLTLRHKSGKEERVSITRRIINIHTVRGFRRTNGHHFDFMLDAAHRIGYVRITQFADKTADELRQALKQLKAAGARGLILDLRFNPGGLLTSAVAVSDMFLSPDRTIVSVKGRVVPKKAYTSTAKTILPDIPMVVLANQASASAAEIVTGALSDNHRARFVGTRTFGKGSVQQVKLLGGGQGALKFTDAYYYIPSGRLIHRREGAKVWGVDPSAGDYVPMKPRQVRRMLDKRRQADVVRRANGRNDGVRVTPALIRKKLDDPQLSAALRAVLGRLSTGDWPKVGRSDAQALVKAHQRATLRLQRQLLQQQLHEVDQKLAQMSGGGNPARSETPAEGEPSSAGANGAGREAERAAGSPINRRAVQEKVNGEQRDAPHQ